MTAASNPHSTEATVSPASQIAIALTVQRRQKQKHPHRHDLVAAETSF